jgi:NAD(P)-dependent dehydrogenase (short-subunit alcohol dehydrogenase family)
VFIVTGSASGVGYELAKLLYGQGGDVYIAARTSEKVNRAIKNIKASAKPSRGRLWPLVLDLADFPTIKKAVDQFLDRENRLDVLIHNAGIMTPPPGSKSKTVSSSTLRSWTLGGDCWRQSGPRSRDGDQLPGSLHLEPPFAANFDTNRARRVKSRSRAYRLALLNDNSFGSTWWNPIRHEERQSQGLEKRNAELYAE